MNITVITLFPEMFTALDHGIIGRAQRQQLLNLTLINPREFSTDPNQRIDDRPYGGGPGMVMQYEPLHQAILNAKHQQPNSKTLLLSPQGTPLTQQAVEQYTQDNLILLAGRYEGVDQRLIENAIDEEVSIGDYVLSGGELPAMCLIDAITRLLPGALGDDQSAVQESFSTGLLDHPHYTRPEQINGQSVPKVLLSGDHKAIERWRLKQALGKTWQKRPDLIKRRILSDREKSLLEEFISNIQDGKEP